MARLLKEFLKKHKKYMKAEATHKYLRISPKKIRELAQTVIGLHPAEAMDRLSVLSDKSSGFLMIAIKSVLSNAVNNMKMNTDSLRITTIEILKGPHFKRWQPVSRGMAHSIKKRTTHLRIVVEDSKINEVKSEDLKSKTLAKENKKDMDKKSERSRSGTKS